VTSLVQLRTYIREQADDSITPQKWSDATLNILINEAQMEACRRARLLKDTTTDAITLVTLSLNQALYTLDPRIIYIRRVQLANRSQPLAFKRTRDMDEELPGWETHTGSVSAYLTDYNTGKLCLYRKPDANAMAQTPTARLTVVRGPLVDMAADGDVPEIAPRFHPKLHHYVLGRIYSKQDSETYDPKSAAAEFALFDAEFGPPPSAAEENWLQENIDYASDSGVF
jgi:hypothetical protein